MGNTATALAPWASGPGEILQHGINLLDEDSDKNRRLAMLSIDNAVELMIKTYLGLPKRVTGLRISRAEYAQISESFPQMLDALEKHSADRIGGINLGEIEWYHRLRNELYHQGNGLTVERNKVVVYAELAQALFERLFGFALEVRKPHSADLLGDFIALWAKAERFIVARAFNPRRAREWRLHGTGGTPNTRAYVDLLGATKEQNPEMGAVVRELSELRTIRNRVVHGDVSALKPEHVSHLRQVIDKLQKLEGQ
jgi:hypothetical protein